MASQLHATDVTPLAAKPDWPRAALWWQAFWDREPMDRPLLAVLAPSGIQPDALPEPADDEARYLDPDWQALRWRHHVARYCFGGEAVAVAGHLMCGWTIGCGDNVAFDPHTIWHHPVMRSIHDAPPWRPGDNDPWRARVDAIVDRLLDEADGHFLGTYAIQLPVNDIIAMLRGVDALLVDLLDDLPRCVEVLRALVPKWIAETDRMRRRVEANQAGCTWGWPGLYSHDFVLITQSDMSCMIGPDLFEQFVLTEMDMLGEHFGRLWYHVDGPDAVRHVPALLSRPYIKAIQYVAGAGNPPNGPAWLDLYRQVQAAGRCLDIDVPPEHVEFVIRHLRPEGVVIRTWIDDRSKIEPLLDNAVRWAGTHA